MVHATASLPESESKATLEMDVQRDCSMPGSSSGSRCASKDGAPPTKCSTAICSEPDSVISATFSSVDHAASDSACSPVDQL